MEIDLINAPFDLKFIKPGELEEALEDPFGIRFLPDSERKDGASRYFALGRTVSDRHLFMVFSTDGKIARVFSARELSEAERRFYDRNYNETR
ncbi:MAG: hypothetical protein RL346_849 [Verrucomicrobiota bacterium]|jgi:uncharacterized DUF497 family protein